MAPYTEQQHAYIRAARRALRRATAAEAGGNARYAIRSYRAVITNLVAVVALTGGSEVHTAKLRDAIARYSNRVFFLCIANGEHG